MSIADECIRALTSFAEFKRAQLQGTSVKESSGVVVLALLACGQKLRKLCLPDQDAIDVDFKAPSARIQTVFRNIASISAWWKTFAARSLTFSTLADVESTELLNSMSMSLSMMAVVRAQIMSLFPNMVSPSHRALIEADLLNAYLRIAWGADTVRAAFTYLRLSLARSRPDSNKISARDWDLYDMCTVRALEPLVQFLQESKEIKGIDPSRAKIPEYFETARQKFMEECGNDFVEYALRIRHSATPNEVLKLLNYECTLAHKFKSTRYAEVVCQFVLDLILVPRWSAFVSEESIQRFLTDVNTGGIQDILDLCGVIENVTKRECSLTNRLETDVAACVGSWTRSILKAEGKQGELCSMVDRIHSELWHNLGIGMAIMDAVGAIIRQTQGAMESLFVASAFESKNIEFLLRVLEPQMSGRERMHWSRAFIDTVQERFLFGLPTPEERKTALLKLLPIGTAALPPRLPLPIRRCFSDLLVAQDVYAQTPSGTAVDSIYVLPEMTGWARLEKAIQVSALSVPDSVRVQMLKATVAVCKHRTKFCSHIMAQHERRQKPSAGAAPMPPKELSMRISALSGTAEVDVFFGSSARPVSFHCKTLAMQILVQFEKPGTKLSRSDYKAASDTVWSNAIGPMLEDLCDQGVLVCSKDDQTFSLAPAFASPPGAIVVLKSPKFDASIAAFYRALHVRTVVPIVAPKTSISLEASIIRCMKSVRTLSLKALCSKIADVGEAELKRVIALLIERGYLKWQDGDRSLLVYVP